MVVNKRHFELIDIDQIPHASEYDYIGFRVEMSPISYKIGDIVRPSRVWVDGEPSDEYLNGACAISIDKLAYAYDGYEGYIGDTILVLGSNNAEGGNDPGEIVMIDAVVLDVVDAATLTKTLTAGAALQHTDDDIINEFGDGRVETLVDCSNDGAKNDLIDWVKRNCPNTELSDYGVLVKNNQYLLVW